MVEVLKAQVSNSKSDLDMGKMRSDVFNQRDETVRGCADVQLVRRCS